VSDVNRLIVDKPRVKKSQVRQAQIRAKNGQIRRLVVNPASPDADSKLMSTLPDTKIDMMLSNNHKNKLPIAIPARRRIKRDFFEISLLSMITENLQSVVSKSTRERI